MPALIDSKNISASSRDSRSMLMVWAWCRQTTSAATERPKIGPGSSRAGAAATALVTAGAVRSPVWLSDLLCSQGGHAGQWQVCLAHLLGDARSSEECGDTMFSLPFKWLLLRAIAIGRRREVLNGSTPARYSADLGRRLGRVLAGRAIDR
jgi:hypothetical protein